LISHLLRQSAIGVLIAACSPLHDLDAVTRSYDRQANAGAGPTVAGTLGSAGQQGGAGGAGERSDASSGDANENASGSTSIAGSSGDADSVGGDSRSLGGTSGERGSVPQGGSAAIGGELTQGGSVSRGGAVSTGSAGSSGSAGGDAAVLPIDLMNTPVTGAFTVSVDAGWEVNGVFEPTFEIHTPTASYWLVKSLGMLVSMIDGSKNPQQWIGYSSSYRPLRGFPSFGSFGTPESMTTTIDEESRTPTHLRLNSRSAHWRLVWDFYPTHVTLTVNAAPSSFGMAYRGVPDGSLESSDQFVRADASAQSALISFVADLAGPAEWAYVSDTVQKRSLFMIQHSDDSKVDRYQVKDNDSAMLSFGDGALQALPQRFSLGLIDSADHQLVSARAAFVIGAIR